MSEWQEKELWTLEWENDYDKPIDNNLRLELVKKKYYISEDENGISILDNNKIIIGMSKKDFDRNYSENPKALVGNAKKYLQEFMIPVHKYALEETEKKIKIMQEYFIENKNI